MSEKTSRWNLTAAQLAASAVAAVASAVAASTLGVAGTLIGAALGSVVATTATAAFLHSVERTKDTVRVVRQAAPGRGSTTLVDVTAGEADTVRTGAGWPRPFPRPWQGLRWQPLAAGVGVVFLVAIGGITAFELASGRTVAATVAGEEADTRSTTLTGLVPDGGSGTSGDPGDADTTGDEEDRESGEPEATSESDAPTLPTDGATPEPDGTDVPPGPGDPAPSDPAPSGPEPTSGDGESPADPDPGSGEPPAPGG